MSNVQLGAVVRQIRSLVVAQDTRARTDRQLLKDFAAHQNQEAFAALVKRHGPLVWRVCRHVLGHEQDAEDAFQATILVLARKASSIRKVEALAGWLHGVAYRTAMKAKRDAARRRAHEAGAARFPQVNPCWNAMWQEVQTVLDEEVQRLPEAYRSAFVLCCLEGLSRADAARQLNVREGTVWSRLALARKRLQRRLGQRGISLSAVLGTAALAPTASATAVPAFLADAAVRAALVFAVGRGAPTPAVSATVVALAKGVLQAMTLTKLEVATVLLLTVGVAFATAGLVAHEAFAAKLVEAKPKDEPKPSPKNGDRPTPETANTVNTDRYGDPLPDGALLRLGTVRQRHVRLTSCAVFTHDSKTVIVGDWGGRVVFWDVATGKEVRRVLADASGVNSLALTADGKLLAAGSRGKVNLWNPNTGAAFTKWTVANDLVAQIAFAPNGKTAALRYEGKTIELWDVASGKKLHTLEGHTGNVFTFAFAPSGETLASGGWQDPNVRIWRRRLYGWRRRRCPRCSSATTPTSPTASRASRAAPGCPWPRSGAGHRDRLEASGRAWDGIQSLDQRRDGTRPAIRSWRYCCRCQLGLNTKRFRGFVLPPQQGRQPGSPNSARCNGSIPAMLLCSKAAES
jgi:RNA polymerase sigma factor (sigma-70 family)